MGNYAMPCLAALAAVSATLPAPAGMVANPEQTNADLINFLVGADTFYQNGYYGWNAAVANVEAGHVWNGHETLQGVSTYINDPSIEFPQRQYDYHATAVGFLINGLGPYTSGVGYYYYQMGIAPSAKLYSAAIATSWDGQTGSFSTSGQSERYAYETSMQSGVTWSRQEQIAPGVSATVTYENRRADVINSSWGFEDSAGTGSTTMMIDALAWQHHQTVVVAAGNHQTTATPPVTGPASGYNTIAVGALAADWSDAGVRYTRVADFSNASPNDFYNPRTGQTIAGVRAKVDIVAPGDSYVLPAYLGQTGTNASAPLDPQAGATDLYYWGMAGTSFASPVVAGGASLLVDAGYALYGTPQAVDGRTIKAVLLNSADKLPGWDNGQAQVDGVLRTTRSLDWSQGAGALNLKKAYSQYTGGTADVAGIVGGLVADAGWDMGVVAKDSPNDYYVSGLIPRGATLTATLDWMVNRQYQQNATTLEIEGTEVQLSDLSLQVWQARGGSPLALIAESNSAYNNVEHLSFALPQEGEYMLRVSWLGDAFGGANPTLSEEYALAWSVAVPEPLQMAGLPLLCAMLLQRRRRGASEEGCLGR